MLLAEDCQGPHRVDPLVHCPDKDRRAEVSVSDLTNLKSSSGRKNKGLESFVRTLSTPTLTVSEGAAHLRPFEINSIRAPRSHFKDSLIWN